MLNVYRRHRGTCSLKGKRKDRIHGKGYCPTKPPCRIYYEGIDGAGRNHKPTLLIDPETDGVCRDWNRACEIIRQMELPTPVEPIQEPKVQIADAVTAYLASKEVNDPDTQKKNRRLLNRLVAFCASIGKTAIADVTRPDLEAFRNTWSAWTRSGKVKQNSQTILKAFFAYCEEDGVDYITKNPARKLSAIPEEKEQTTPFQPEEVQRIIEALPKLTDEYGRHGEPIALQTKAFVYVMRYTGLSIGDTTTLEKSHVDGCRIRTYRKKTNEDVYVRVPKFVIDALYAAPHDSNTYFFWTGEGKRHSRSNKWGTRLQRLFVIADVKTKQVMKRRRSGGKLKDEPELVTISEATPHMFRHTFARDWLLAGNSMEDLAAILGNSVKIIEKHYSKWDKRRQKRLDESLSHMWEDDPLTQQLGG
jgi:integrase